MLARAIRIWVAIVFLMCFAGSSAAAAAAAAAGAGNGNHPFVVRNVRIFDGQQLIPGDSVAVVDGKIAAVGRNVGVPPNAEVIDGTGKTLLPGLIDSHVHAWNRDVLRMGLVMGATTELDMYMRWEEAQRWKEEESRGAFDIADFRTAGTCFAVAGGHGTEVNLPPLIPILMPQEAQAFVDERIDRGSDYIKIMYDNGPRFAAMPKDVLVAIVKAAHKRGKMVVVHVFSPQGILDVIDSGADGLAHVPIVKMPEPQFQDALKTHHIFAITTLGFTDFFFGTGRLATKLPQDPSIAPYLDPLMRQALEQPAWESPEHISYSDNQAALRTLRDAGVPLLAGTDASGTEPAGALQHTELELMVQAGMRPSEALADATSVPAKVFGLSDRGRIAPGLRADLLLVRGDATRDIRKTREIVAIWKQGVRVDRDSFRNEVAQKVEQKNAAWRFGAGWEPAVSSDSTIRVTTADGGPNGARITMILAGEVKPTNDFLSAGAIYVPSLAYPMASRDISGTSVMSFWARGDGKTYTMTLYPYPGGGTPTTKYFIASKDWSQIVFQFSDFGTDGKDTAAIRIASSIPGPFHLELADARIGAHRWLGVDPGNALDGAKVESVEGNSAAQKAGLKAGDLITGFNGKPVKSFGNLMSLLSETHVGDKVPVEVERHGKNQTLFIVVAERRE